MYSLYIQEKGGEMGGRWVLIKGEKRYSTNVYGLVVVLGLSNGLVWAKLC